MLKSKLDSGTVVSHGIVDGLKQFRNKDTVKALMSMGEARSMECCILSDDSAFSLTSYDVGAAKTWVHKHTTHARWK